MTPIEMIFEDIDESQPEMIKNVFEAQMVIFYADGEKSITKIKEIPPGFVKNRHYNISDLYGYTVIDDRKGL